MNQDGRYSHDRKSCISFEAAPLTMQYLSAYFHFRDVG